MDILHSVKKYANEGRLAVICDGEQLTYSELDKMSDAIATYFIKEYKEDKSPIVIHGNKENLILVLMLGALKSGRAYIPLDVTFPVERVKQVIDEVKAKIVINFTEEDLYITLTYAGKAPTVDRAKKDMRNFLDRIRTWRKKNKPKEEFKYIYVIDYVDDPDKTKRTRIHHHLVMSGMDMDVVRKNWKLGRKTVEKLQPDEVGFEGLATYMANQSKTKYGRSRNLKKPKITKSRTSLSNRKAESLGMDVNMHKDFFEGKYKDLLFIGCDVYKSKDYPGIYIRTKMRKRE